MAKKEKMKPYKPVPYRDGYKILKHYEVEETDSMGFKRLLKCCDFLDKKGKLNEKYILQVVQLGNDNILSSKAAEELVSSFVDEKLPHVWYDGYVMAFTRYKEDLYIFFAWDSEPRIFWSELYFKIKKEHEQAVLDFYKSESPLLTDEEHEAMEESGEASLATFENFIKAKDENDWMDDIVFIKRNRVKYSGVRGSIAQMKLEESMKHW